MSSLSIYNDYEPIAAAWVAPEPRDESHAVARVLQKLTGPQHERVERMLDRISRGETRGASFTWIDFSITIRWVAGRLVLSLFSRDAFGTVVGYVVEEVLGHEPLASFPFAGKMWRPKS